MLMIGLDRIVVVSGCCTPSWSLSIRRSRIETDGIGQIRRVSEVSEQESGRAVTSSVVRREGCPSRSMLINDHNMICWLQEKPCQEHRRPGISLSHTNASCLVGKSATEIEWISFSSIRSHRIRSASRQISKSVGRALGINQILPFL